MLDDLLTVGTFRNYVQALAQTRLLASGIPAFLSRDHPSQSRQKTAGEVSETRLQSGYTLEECDLLLAQVSGADHVVIWLLIQLGLRSEELFGIPPR